MTDYRVIANKKGEIGHERNQNYSASMSYADVLKALFGTLTASYYYSRRNLMYGTIYEGSLSRIEAVKKPNTIDGYILYGKISKRFKQKNGAYSIIPLRKNSIMLKFNV